MPRSLPFTAMMFCALAAVTLSTGVARSAPIESNRFISFGLGGGVSVPVSDAKDAFKNGFNGQGFVRLNFNWLPITPRLDFTFQKFDLRSAQVTGPALPSGTGSMIAGVANFQIPLIGGPIQPYLVAGIGAYNLTTELDDAASTSEEVTRFGINGGAGLIIKLGIVSLYAEGRVDNVYTDKGAIDAKSIQIIPVTFGLVY